MRRFIVVLAVMVIAAAMPARANEKANSHEGFFKHYEGTKTCLRCHKDSATDFFHSQHYQWRGEAPDVVNADGQKLGKMNTINDFCTNPLPGFIKNVKNSRGETVSEGCSECHAGLGKMPSSEISREQLENIDCLICHSPTYERELHENEDGSLEWRSIVWEDKEALDLVAKNITMPQRDNCLHCHSESGGAANMKRGDLEHALADTDRDFDVHMGTDGANMTCVDCHGGSKHRIRGRGVDLMGTDNADDPLSCDGCHGTEPHAKELLNRHAVRVDCTVCHIPTFAKSHKTDMRRDWSKPFHNEAKDKYAPTLTLRKNVEPEIAWYNGTITAQLPGVPVTVGSDGAIQMVTPMGSRDDPEAKLYAFKVHGGRMPVLKDKRWLLPINAEDFFGSSQIDLRVRQAAEVFYDMKDIEYEWMEIKRFMGIFHEVQPGQDALRCLDCHGDDGRLDWAGLGYEADPLAAALAPSH